MKQLLFGLGIVVGAWSLSYPGAMAAPDESVETLEPIVLAKRPPACTTWAEFVQDLPTSGGRGGQWWNYGKLPKKFSTGCLLLSDNNSLDSAYVFQVGMDSTPYGKSGDYGSRIPSPRWEDRDVLNRSVQDGKLFLITWLTPTNGAIPYLKSIPHDRTFQREDGMTCLSTVCLRSGGLSHADLSNILRPSPVESRPEPSTLPPPKTLTPIATGPTYSYPKSSELATFKKTYTPGYSLSATDRVSRNAFQQTWKAQNPAIAPYIGAWKTADDQMLYVYPSTVTSRFCVVTQKDGRWSTGIGTSLNREARYDGTFGLFRVDGLSDAIAARADRGQPLSTLYAAIGSPELSDDLKEELTQAKCITELPTGKRSSPAPRR